MTVPVWILLGFAAWTLATLLGSIGVYRWTRILTGRADLVDFPTDTPHGEEWYRRAMRAHANCIENLPIYGAVVLAIVASGAESDTLDVLAIVLLVARVFQTLIHISFTPTNAVVGTRFAFFFVQLVCMIWMGVSVALYAL